MSYAGCPGLSLAISAQFTLKMSQPEIAKKPKNPYFVQGHLRSSTLTPIKSLSPVLVVISTMSVPICNRFHATRDDCGKISTF